MATRNVKKRTCAGIGCKIRFTPSGRGRPRQYCCDGCKLKAHRLRHGPPTLRYLSLGAGVQSSVLALMAARNEIEPPKLAIFSDTGWEPDAVYRHLDWLCEQLPFEVLRVSAGNLRTTVWAAGNGAAFMRLPAFTKGPDGRGILRRQCTQEFKITPIQRKVRQLLGVKPKYPVPRDIRAEALIGISTDEAHRMKPARERWLTKSYPLIDLGMSRADCLTWLEEQGYPRAPRSSCVGCPFHSDQEWQHLKTTEPGAFAETVALDKHIRDSTAAGVERPVYLHSSLVPLGEVDFTRNKPGGWGNECEGMCGN